MPEAEGQGSCPQHGGSPQNGVRAETLPMIFADAGLVDWSGWKMRLSSLTVELSELVSEVQRPTLTNQNNCSRIVAC